MVESISQAVNHVRQRMVKIKRILFLVNLLILSPTGDVGVECIGCNHYTAWRYYAESVRSPTPLFISLRCPDGVTEYTEDNCKGSETASMGFYANADSKHGNYYVKTNSVAPFSN